MYAFESTHLLDHLDQSNKQMIFLEIASSGFEYKTLLKFYHNTQIPPIIRLKILQYLTGESYLEHFNDDVEKMEKLLKSPFVLLEIFKRIAEIRKGNSSVVGLRDIDALLLNDYVDLNKDEQEFILNEVLSPMFFSNPQELTLPIFNKIYEIFKRSKVIKNFLFYVATRSRAPPSVKERANKIMSERKDLFILHRQVEERLAKGEVEVLVMHNVKDGQGDELIRMHTFIQALLDYNPDLRVTLVTERGYLYDHPRVSVVSIQDDLKSVFGLEYDVIVNHYDPRQRYSDEIEERLKYHLGRVSLSSTIIGKLQNKKTMFMNIETNKSSDNFTFEKVIVEGVQYESSLELNKVKASNVYDPVFRLLVELGIPFSVGEENDKENSLIVEVPYEKAHSEWIDMMKTINNYDEENERVFQPVVIINPFGGEGPGKGYSARVHGEIRELREHMHLLIASGLKIVILPNGKEWGTRLVAEQIVDEMSEEDKKSIVIGPEPKEDSRFFKYFVSYADYLLTVEGGMMHLGYMLGKPMGVVLKAGAGPAKWLPYGMSENQGVITGADAAAEKYRLMNSRRNQGRGDMAMIGKTVEVSASKKPGGIDFNPKILDLKIKGGVFQYNSVNLTSEQLEMISANGLIPVIVNISPVENLFDLLTL